MVVGKNNENIRNRHILTRTLLAGQAFAQSGSVVQQGGAGHAAQASCVILKAHGASRSSHKVANIVVGQWQGALTHQPRAGTV
jgi:hypothetical protein